MSIVSSKKLCGLVHKKYLPSKRYAICGRKMNPITHLVHAYTCAERILVGTEIHGGLVIHAKTERQSLTACLVLKHRQGADESVPEDLEHETREAVQRRRRGCGRRRG